MPSRHSNLTNPASEPEHAPVEVTCTVTFDMFSGAKFPKKKFERWLASLPDTAKIRFTGISSGKPYFEASWTEER